MATVIGPPSLWMSDVATVSGAGAFTLDDLYAGSDEGNRSHLLFLSYAADLGAAVSAITAGPGGISASSVATFAAAGAIPHDVWLVSGLAGEEIDLSISISGGNAYWMVATIVPVYGLGTLLDTASDSTLSTNTLDLDIDVEAGGSVFTQAYVYHSTGSDGGQWLFTNTKKRFGTRGIAITEAYGFAAHVPAATATINIDAIIADDAGTRVGQSAFAVSFQAGNSGLGGGPRVGGKLAI